MKERMLYQSTMSISAVQRQRDYYEETAEDYDKMHLRDPEHGVALAQLSGYLNYYSFRSLLDVGAGTGRVLRYMAATAQNLQILGVEPVRRLREVAYKKNISPDLLIDGDATDLMMEDNSWDLVSAFGILHHIPEPNKAVKEMCRVAKHGVFFSDLNNFGCGSVLQRAFSQSLHTLRLWKPFQWIKNGGRLDKFSEGDGVHYSYSLFDSLDVVREKFPQTFICNTRGASADLYRGCSHVSVFAVRSMDDLASLDSSIQKADVR